MSDFWAGLSTACDQLEPGAALETPVSKRLFEIGKTFDDGITIRFQDSGEERTLRREQFEVVVDSLNGEPLGLDTLPSRVEPYAAVLSLSPEHVSADGSLAWDPETAVGGRSPHLVSPEETRTRPERVHDDAVLLADMLDRLDTDDLSTLDTERLTDLYVLLSDVQRGSDRLRRTVSEPLLDRLGPDQQLHGRFGTVRRTARERKRPKDDETVLDALDEHGIPHEWVLGVDPDRLDVVLAVTELTEAAVYEIEEQVYVQKTGVDETEKFSRLQGLADSLEAVEGGEELQEDIAELEQRLDEVLSAG